MLAERKQEAAEGTSAQQCGCVRFPISKAACAAALAWLAEYHSYFDGSIDHTHPRASCFLLLQAAVSFSSSSSSILSLLFPYHAILLPNSVPSI